MASSKTPSARKTATARKAPTALNSGAPGAAPRSSWPSGFAIVLTCAALATAVFASAALVVQYEILRVYLDRSDLPDPGPLTRFEFPSIGHIYDVNGQPLVELAVEYRQITPFADVPPIMRDAVVAAEDKRFFEHDGVDYMSLPRVLGTVRVGAWWTWVTRAGHEDVGRGRSIFPQGGSTITQQLVRGVFLQEQTAVENSHELRSPGLLSRWVSDVIGARNVNMMRRKREELRLSIWLEREMGLAFGSKQRAKEEIFARYASFVYMGNGQYGFARAAEYYFGRPLSTFTVDDADKAAMLAGIAKSPRDYAPSATGSALLLHRRNQVLALMAARASLSPGQAADAQRRPLAAAVARNVTPFQSSAVVDHVLSDLTTAHPDLGLDDLLQGRIQVHTTVDARVQRIANDALLHGLERYEGRHPRATGVVQGAVVVLNNRDGSILAEVGGRQVYQGRATVFRDFNRVRDSLRQPGSTMKPFVYLAAFRQGDFTLETLVPDEPISVPNGNDMVKWISNYDGRFKGSIPIREGLAESRNAVAMWISARIGIDAVVRTARSLGVQTPLHRYPTTALGASEVSLMELASAYRAIASGVVVSPYIIQRVVRERGAEDDEDEPRALPRAVDDPALELIQEGLRGVVRMPTGTAHALASRGFPIAVMGKTGTTNDFRDALFVGSTYGQDGITVAVRIGYDDNRSLGNRETGGRVALPVFREVMLEMYRGGILGAAPAFPVQMEQRITSYLRGDLAAATMTVGTGEP